MSDNLDMVVVVDLILMMIFDNIGDMFSKSIN